MIDPIADRTPIDEPRGLPILVVDDDEITRELIACILSRAGYHVLEAADGEDAWDIVRAGHCRMVVSDWEMLRLNGLELCHRIRNSDLPGYVYFIMITSRQSRQATLEGLAAGADEFLCKPVDPEELTMRVRTGTRILALETRDLAIFAMAKLAESRDPETGEHLERIRTYCDLIATELRSAPPYDTAITPEFLRTLRLTSPLHDIGKVGIPDAVLLKPGRLNEEEFSIMKQHTMIGGETLDKALRQHPGVRFIEMARDIAYFHHERFNGSGYPQGLSGNAIPLAARIVAVADVYDALTSRRVYKSAFSHTVAKNMVLEETGKHFDPDIVAAFSACCDKMNATRERLSVEVEYAVS